GWRAPGRPALSKLLSAWPRSLSSVRADDEVTAAPPNGKRSAGRALRPLRLALRLEHGGVERLARRFARPAHKLEGGEIALAGIERGAEQRLALPARGIDATGQHQRMPVHDQPVLTPQVEMPDPHLLVDQRDQLLHLAAAALRDLEL